MCHHAVHHLQFFFEILMAGPVCVTLPNFLPISQTVVEIWPFLFLKVAAVHLLGFMKFGNFKCRACSEGQCALPCQIAWRSAEIWSFFRFFKMAAVGHLVFLKVGNFNCRYLCEGQYVSSCQISGWSDQSLPRYGDYSRWQLSTILDF